MDLRFDVEEPGGHALRSLQFALSRALYQASGFNRQAKGQAQAVSLGLKLGSNAKSQLHLLFHLLQSHRILLRQVWLRSRPCSVPSHGTGGGQMVIANRAVYVCLRDERGLGNVLPVELALGC